MRWGKRDGDERLEAAWRRALPLGAWSSQRSASLLTKGLDRPPVPEQPAATPASRHANIRGPQDYQEDPGERSCYPIRPLDTLQALRLHGRYHARVAQRQMPDITTLSCAARLGLLVDRERTEREDRRRTTRLRQAQLRQAACLADRDYRQPRGLDTALMTP